MQIRSLSIEGTWVLEPTIHGDHRGSFAEWFKSSRFREVVGHDFTLAQANSSVSARGVLRGIHFADVPPGQGKHVTCASGSVLDVVVDIRVGSPTFGRWESVVLDASSRRAVYISEGLGHGFVALEDGSTVMYLCTTEYTPAAEHEVHPLDPVLGIDWGLDGEQPQLSAKDAAAPGLRDAAATGLLPVYEECVRWRSSASSNRSR